MIKSVEAIGTSKKIDVTIRINEPTYKLDKDALECMWNKLVGMDAGGIALMYSTIVSSGQKNAPVLHEIVRNGIVEILEKMRDHKIATEHNSEYANKDDNQIHVDKNTVTRYGRILCPHMGNCDRHEFRCCSVCSGYLDTVYDVDRCPFKNGKFSEIVNLEFLHVMTPNEKIFDYRNRMNE